MGPSMWYYLSLWYDAEEIKVAYSRLVSATAIAGVVGAPIAAEFLALDGMCGLRGWQWLFLGEGLPTILIALATPLVLPCNHQSAPWLALQEKRWYAQRAHNNTTSSGKMASNKPRW